MEGVVLAANFTSVDSFIVDQNAKKPHDPIFCETMDESTITLVL